MVVENFVFGVVDVERHHDDSRKSGSSAKRAELFQVTDQVATSVADFPAALPETFELAETLDERQREKEEHAETSQPGCHVDSGGGAAGEDAKGIEPAEHEDVEEQLAFQIQRVTERSDRVNRQPEKEPVGRLHQHPTWQVGHKM